MGPKPTAVDQAGRPPRKPLAEPVGFQSADGWDSSRDSKASRGDHLHDFLGGQGIGGEYGALLGLKGNHGVKHVWVCFQHAIDASRAATTGHAGDGQVVRSLAHG